MICLPPLVRSLLPSTTFPVHSAITSLLHHHLTRRHIQGRITHISLCCLQSQSMSYASRINLVAFFAEITDHHRNNVAMTIGRHYNLYAADIDCDRDPSIKRQSHWSRFKISIQETIDDLRSPPPTCEPSHMRRGFRKAKRHLNRFAARLKESVTGIPPITHDISWYHRQAACGDPEERGVFSSQLGTPQSSLLPNDATLPAPAQSVQMSSPIPSASIPKETTLLYPHVATPTALSVPSNISFRRKPVPQASPTSEAKLTRQTEERGTAAWTRYDTKQAGFGADPGSSLTRITGVSSQAYPVKVGDHYRIDGQTVTFYTPDHSVTDSAVVTTEAQLPRSFSFKSTYDPSIGSRLIDKKGKKGTEKHNAHRRSRLTSTQATTGVSILSPVEAACRPPTRIETGMTGLSGSTANDDKSDPLRQDSSRSLVDSIKRRASLKYHLLEKAETDSDGASFDSTSVAFHHNHESLTKDSIVGKTMNSMSIVLPKFGWEAQDEQPWSLGPCHGDFVA